MIGQETQTKQHGDAVQAISLVDCLRVTVMGTMNVLETFCVDLIIVSVSFMVVLTVVLNPRLI